MSRSRPAVRSTRPSPRWPGQRHGAARPRPRRRVPSPSSPCPPTRAAGPARRGAHRQSHRRQPVLRRAGAAAAAERGPGAGRRRRRRRTAGCGRGRAPAHRPPRATRPRTPWPSPPSSGARSISIDSLPSPARAMSRRPSRSPSSRRPLGTGHPARRVPVRARPRARGVRGGPRPARRGPGPRHRAGGVEPTRRAAGRAGRPCPPRVGRGGDDRCRCRVVGARRSTPPSLRSTPAAARRPSGWPSERWRLTVSRPNGATTS